MEAPRLPGIGEANNQRSESAIRQIALQLKNDYAPLVDPVFTGDPQAPTPTAGDNDTSIATTAFVQTELSAYAPKASPVFTGNPTAPTPSPGDNDTSVATTAFVTDAVSTAKTATEAKTISAGTGLTGGGALSTNPTLGLANTAVTPGSYTLASITVDAQGRLTSAADGASPAPTLLASGSLTGATVSVTGLPTTYERMNIVFRGASHNNGASTVFQVQTSDNNGSSYSAANVLTSGYVAADLVDINAYILNARATSIRKFLQCFSSSGSGSQANVVNPFMTTTGAVNALRFSMGAGSFDAGTYEIYGIP